MSKFTKVNDKYYLFVNNKKYARTYLDNFLVRCSTNASCGYIRVPELINIPKEFIGKRIKIIMEVQDEPKEISKKDQPEWMKEEKKKAEQAHKKLALLCQAGE